MLRRRSSQGLGTRCTPRYAEGMATVAEPAVHYDHVLKSPVGLIGVRIEAERLVEIAFLPESAPPASPVCHPLVRQIDTQLRRYFDEPMAGFTLPLALQGTPFQTRVWRALRAIPPGQTLTYGALARQLGSSARAVGGACRANPLPIVVPCHRIVSATGVGGFAGALVGPKLQVKRWLLAHEQRH